MLFGVESGGELLQQLQGSFFNFSLFFRSPPVKKKRHDGVDDEQVNKIPAQVFRMFWGGFVKLKMINPIAIGVHLE